MSRKNNNNKKPVSGGAKMTTQTVVEVPVDNNLTVEVPLTVSAPVAETVTETAAEKYKRLLAEARDVKRQAGLDAHKLPKEFLRCLSVMGFGNTDFSVSPDKVRQMFVDGKDFEVTEEWLAVAENSMGTWNKNKYPLARWNSMKEDAAFYLVVNGFLTGLNVSPEGMSAAIEYAGRVRKGTPADKVIGFWMRALAEYKKTDTKETIITMKKRSAPELRAMGIVVPEEEEQVQQVSVQEQVIGFSRKAEPEPAQKTEAKTAEVKAEVKQVADPKAFLDAKVSVLRSLGATTEQIIAAIAATSMT